MKKWTSLAAAAVLTLGLAACSDPAAETATDTGDKPDIAFWQPTASMLTAINAKTNLQPLDDAPWLTKLSPDLKDITGILDGTRYAALITSPAVEGVYYDKEVFAANGITSTPKNFEEMVALARTLKGKGVTPFHEMAADRWATQWWGQVHLPGRPQDDPGGAWTGPSTSTRG